MCKFKRLVLGFWRWCSNVVARVRVSRGGGVHFLLKRVRSPSYIFRVNSTRYGSIRASHPRISRRRVRTILFPVRVGVPVVRYVLELLPLVVPADARRHRRFLLRLGNAFRSGKFLLDLRRPFRRRARVRVVTSRVVQDGHVFGQMRLFCFVLLSMLFRSNKSAAVFDDACKRARGKMRYTRVLVFPL